jgi:hypothetical protein
MNRFTRCGRGFVMTDPAGSQINFGQPPADISSSGHRLNFRRNCGFGER